MVNVLTLPLTSNARPNPSALLIGQKPRNPGNIKIALQAFTQAKLGSFLAWNVLLSMSISSEFFTFATPIKHLFH